MDIRFGDDLEDYYDNHMVSLKKAGFEHLNLFNTIFQKLVGDDNDKVEYKVEYDYDDDDDDDLW